MLKEASHELSCSLYKLRKPNWLLLRAKSDISSCPFLADVGFSMSVSEDLGICQSHPVKLHGTCPSLVISWHSVLISLTDSMFIWQHAVLTRNAGARQRRLVCVIFIFTLLSMNFKAFVFLAALISFRNSDTIVILNNCRTTMVQLNNEHLCALKHFPVSIRVSARSHSK